MEILNPYGFIYITTNMVNGKKYVGQKKFVIDWKYYVGSGIALKKAIKIYGRKNFHRDIVYISYSKKELDEAERKYIKQHNAVKSHNYYNCSDGGHTGNPYAGKTEEEMKMYVLFLSNSQKGKKLTDEHRVNLSKAKQGKYKGADNPAARAVICVTTNKRFNTVQEAADFYKVNRSNICSCCAGRIKSTGKKKDGTPLKWQYYDKYLNEKNSTH